MKIYFKFLLILILTVTLVSFTPTSSFGVSTTTVNLKLSTGQNSAEGNVGSSQIKDGESDLSVTVNDQVIPNEYIVVLKENTDVDSISSDFTKRSGIRVDLKYKTALKGFAANISQEAISEIKEDPRVKFVSENRVVKIASHRSPQINPTGVSRIAALSNSNKGTGVGVAVIDTGIDLDHPDLASNIVADKNCIRPRRSGDDDNGHGSHVAGTIAALNNSVGVLGVAPEAKLIAVKVLNSSGYGTWASVICGVDWATANASLYNIRVANMSLGGGGISDNNCGNSNNDALHQAICRSKDSGITYVVAAGNSFANASNFVPAAYDDAVITVSALADSDGRPFGLGPATSYGTDDTFTTFSNFGNVVDLAGPGVSIRSTWKSGDYKTISGTSIAAPHVAGSVALYTKNNPGASWTAVRDALRSQGEALGSGHTDSSGLHPEPLVWPQSL